MRGLPAALVMVLTVSPVEAQSTGKWPPDSLVNTVVIPKNTPVLQVVGRMRNFTSDLGVRCEFCHDRDAGKPLTTFDFPSDRKRTKAVAREMMRMVDDINRRLDSLPGRPTPAVRVTCSTCHRGVARPMPLSALIAETAQAAGADSAVAAYRGLRTRHYGSGAYDFGESSLNVTAFRLGRANRFPEAFRILDLNAEFFPNSSGMEVFRGNIELMRGDTVAARRAFQEAIRRDPANEEARGRLEAVKPKP